MTKTGPSIKSRIVDILSFPIRIFAFLLSILPMKTVQWIGTLLGLIWFYALPIRKKVVVENLRLALPDLSDGERSRIARKTFCHVSMSVLELLWFSPSRHQKLEQIVEIDGLEHYEKVRGQGRGVIAITAHLGNFDMLACSQSLSGVPLSIVTKELSSQGISRLWMERRARAGVRFLPDKGSMLGILRALRRGEVVGVVIDQRTEKSQGGSPVDFFGHPAMTTTAPAVLAARTGAALIPVRTFRKKNGTHYVGIEAEVEVEKNALDTMLKINAILERWIRQTPDQWLWLHKRWQMPESKGGTKSS